MKLKNFKNPLKAIFGSLSFIILISVNTLTIQSFSSKIFFMIIEILLYLIFLQYFEMWDKLNKKEQENDK